LNSFIKKYWKYILLVAAVGIFFSPTLDNGWLDWDDPYYVLNNEMVIEFNASNAMKFFLPENGVMDIYTPLTLIAYGVQYSLFEASPYGYHFVSLLLHIIVTILIFRVTQKLTKRETFSLVVALIFGLHPIHVESVGWISDQKDLWCSIFLLSAMLQYIRYLEAEVRNTFRNKNFWFTFLLFVLAILSKPTALPLPVLLLCLDWLYYRKISATLALEKAPFFGVSIGIFFLGISLSATSLSGFSIVDKIALSGESALLYIQKTLLPINLSGYYPNIKIPEEIDQIYYVVGPILIIVFGALIFRFRKDRLATFSLLFFIWFLLLALPIIKVHTSIIYDRYMYLASFGLILFIGHVMLKGLKQQELINRRSKLIGVGGLCLVFGILSFQRMKVWKNDFTLFSDVVDQFSDDFLPHSRLAHFHLKNGDSELALQECNLALKDNPEEYESYNNRGMLYLGLNKLDLAYEDFSNAIKYKQNYYTALVNRANVCLNTNRYQQAIADLNTAEESKQDDYALYYNRGLAYERISKLQLTLKDLLKAQELNPNDVAVLSDLGRIEIATNKYADSEVHLSKAIALEPNYAAAYYFRSFLHAANNNNALALKDALKAQGLGFRVNQLYLNELQNP
jgi:tetratricopeptide (TPR) repeat protein